MGVAVDSGSGKDTGAVQTEATALLVQHTELTPLNSTAHQDDSSGSLQRNIQLALDLDGHGLIASVPRLDPSALRPLLNDQVPRLRQHTLALLAIAAGSMAEATEILAAGYMLSAYRYSAMDPNNQIGAPLTISDKQLVRK